MDIGVILLSLLLLFIIIYSAVKLAISPLLDKSEDIINDSKDFGLVKLRDIEVLNDTELEEVIELYQKKSINKEDHVQYQKYAKILNELKQMGYFTEEQYLDKLDRLKDYFKVN